MLIVLVDILCLDLGQVIVGKFQVTCFIQARHDLLESATCFTDAHVTLCLHIVLGKMQKSCQLLHSLQS